MKHYNETAEQLEERIKILEENKSVGSKLAAEQCKEILNQRKLFKLFNKEVWSWINY